jgi:pyrroloquinoline quinone (PQQ) biosynthesis protein C
VSISIEQRLRTITSHPALDNRFYRLWMEKELGIEALEIFARNYGAWVKSFPDSLAILVTTTDDVHAKAEYVKTLFSEMGYGNPDKAHWVLLDEFFRRLAEKMGGSSRLERDRLERELDLLPASRELIHGERDLYSRRDYAFGSQLALEWHAYTMLRQLYDGARNYLHLWSSPDEFHEACEYFYVHIGAAEKEHKDESLSAVKRYALNPESLERIAQGYDSHLDLIARFWEGLHGAMSSVAA